MKSMKLNVLIAIPALVYALELAFLAWLISKGYSDIGWNGWRISLLVSLLPLILTYNIFQTPLPSDKWLVTLCVLGPWFAGGIVTLTSAFVLFDFSFLNVGWFYFIAGATVVLQFLVATMRDFKYI